jgi:hypothetical protein
MKEVTQRGWEEFEYFYVIIHWAFLNIISQGMFREPLPEDFIPRKTGKLGKSSN